jgi:hypothetical protein
LLPPRFDEEMLSAVRIIARRLGFHVVDRTNQGGAFWIVAGYEWATLFGCLGMQFSSTGGQATAGLPSWYGSVPNLAQ